MLHTALVLNAEQKCEQLTALYSLIVNFFAEENKDPENDHHTFSFAKLRLKYKRDQLYSPAVINILIKA